MEWIVGLAIIWAISEVYLRLRLRYWQGRLANAKRNLDSAWEEYDWELLRSQFLKGEDRD